MRTIARPLLLSVCLSLAACGAEPPETSVPWRYAPKADWTLEQLQDSIARVFLAEHYTAQVSSAMRSDIRNNPPGGILFWNGGAGQHVGALELRKVIATYAQEASDAGGPPLLFSTDYEGGALRRSVSWKSIPGIQRFTEGFSALAHPRWLGQAFRHDPALGRELASLHGEIMGQELAAVGLTYPLAVVGDLAHGLFAVRGIDTDEQIVADLLREVLDGALSAPGMLFVTKHFPGLGQTTGDTHDNVVVSPVTDPVEAERHLEPFRAAVEHLAGTPDAARLSVMCGHAKFPLFDDEHNTTTSPRILQNLLREDPEGNIPVPALGFTGIAVSDAMWMGPYGTMSWTKLRRVYLQSFLAGMDLLMIPGYRFDQARGYFADVLDESLSSYERSTLSAQIGLPWSELHQLFVARLQQSLDRIDAAAAATQQAAPVSGSDNTLPSALTGELRQRYHEILVQVDSRWSSELASP